MNPSSLRFIPINPYVAKRWRSKWCGLKVNLQVLIRIRLENILIVYLVDLFLKAIKKCRSAWAFTCLFKLMTLGCADSCDKVWWPQKRVVRLFESAHFVSPRILQYKSVKPVQPFHRKFLMFTQQLKRNFSSAFTHLAFSMSRKSKRL